MNRDHALPIVVCYTSNFVVPAATTILSIIESAHSTTKYHIISLVEAPIDSTIVNALKSLDKKGIVDRWSFIDMSGRVPDAYFGSFSIGSLYRIMIPELLPEYSTALYLDCDIIVQNDLSPLFDIDLDGYLLGGVRESIIKENEGHYNSIGLQDPSFYINSGVLLMNLEAMREERFSDQLMATLQREEAKKFKFPDQDAYNILAEGRITALPPIYNSIRTFYPSLYKSDFLEIYTLEDWHEVHRHGNIHYTSAKPWRGYAIQFDKWWRHYLQLPDTIKSEMEVSNKAFRLYKLWQMPVLGSIIRGLLKVKDKIQAHPNR